MIPPPAEDTTPAAENPPHGSLLVGWNGGLEKEEDIGAGFRVRFELDARGIHTIPWGGPFTIDGRGGAAFRVSILRPTVLSAAGHRHSHHALGVAVSGREVGSRRELVPARRDVPTRAERSGGSRQLQAERRAARSAAPE